MGKFYDFKNSPFEKFCILKLNEKLGFQDVLTVSKNLFIATDEDLLYDEIDSVNAVLPNLVKDVSLDKMWVEVFQKLNCPELLKVVSKILSIPVSNAIVERMFSLMKNVWTDNRNCLDTAMVKAELCVKFNFKMTCSEFNEYISNSNQVSLLEMTAKTNKYDFKAANHV